MAGESILIVDDNPTNLKLVTYLMRAHGYDVRTAIEIASDAALSAFTGLRAVQHGGGDITAVFRAVRYLPRAEEALYPLAAKFPPVNTFFVNPALRDDAAFASYLSQPAAANTARSALLASLARASAPLVS